MSSASLFKQRSFTFLWWGQLLSITGDRLTYLALMGLLLEHSLRPDSPSFTTLLALFGNVVVAPVLLFAPFAGALIDRLDLKRVAVVADALRAINVLAITLVYTVHPDVFATFALVFTLFGLNVLFLPAKSALIPAIVPAEQLLRANSHLAIAAIVATGVGALAGGYIVDHYGWALAMQIDAATYLISVFTLAMIPYAQDKAVSAKAPVGVRTYLAEVWDGWTELRHNAGVLTCVIALAAVWFAGGVLHVAGNPHVLTSAQNLQQNPDQTMGMFQIGMLLCIIGIGTAVGTWWINTRGRRFSATSKLGGGLILASGAIALFSSSTQLAILFAAGFLVGLFAAPALILTETGLQQFATPQRRARIFSGKDFLMRLTLLASVSSTAWLVSFTGTTVTLWICAVVICAVGFTLLRRPLLD
ncbi:MAG: MFS transporter [Gammaproteobacteria bacterium]|nr:MFS transporter [Gammaproteobacteria bacterium]